MTQIIRESGLDDALIKHIKEQALCFLVKCRHGTADYSLTPSSDFSTFTLCFSLFLANTLGHLNDLEPEFPLFAKRIVEGVYLHAKDRKKEVDLQFDKSFLQLLAFSLSALSLLDTLGECPLDELVVSLLPDDMNEYLFAVHSFDGVPQSGNLAMCMAVFTIYAQDYLGIDTGNSISDWVAGHISNMNKFGFWGEEKTTHLQFQNGYHQYEIFEYLGVENIKIENAARFIKGLADKRGQFAPYFGGSGCYDFDAVSILSSSERDVQKNDLPLLERVVKTIISDQNKDGGFSESQWIRPRSLKTLCAGMQHVIAGKGTAILERGRYFLALQLPKHNRIHTHWTAYSRKWGESNLWDTWFRLMTLARIDCAMNADNRNRWGFIDFPGIGFHTIGAGKS